MGQRRGPLDERLDHALGLPERCAKELKVALKIALLLQGALGRAHGAKLIGQKVGQLRRVHGASLSWPVGHGPPRQTRLCSTAAQPHKDL